MRQTLIDYSNKYGRWKTKLHYFHEEYFHKYEHSLELREMTASNYTLISHITFDYCTLNHHHNHNRHVVSLTKEFSRDCGLVLPLSFSSIVWLPWKNTVNAYYFLLFFPSLLFFFLYFLLLTNPSCVHSYMHQFIHSVVCIWQVYSLFQARL